MPNERLNQPQEDHIDKIFLVTLERIAQIFRSSLWAHAKKENLSPIQMQFLMHIASHPGRYSTVSQIAREFNLTQPTVSDAVKSLEMKKLIQRIHSRRDKRKHLLTLTHEGQKLTRKLKHWIDPFNDSLKGYSLTEKKKVLDFLLRFLSSLGEIGLLQNLRSCFSCDYFMKNGSANEENSRCVLRNVPLNGIDFRLNCPNYKSSMLS
ncbi:MAG: MarR family winged helix-turn-helix transcriptional regulator [Candidatus Hodarchaeota archaeon]